MPKTEVPMKPGRWQRHPDEKPLVFGVWRTKDPPRVFCFFGSLFLT